jgi:hypothetical protein
MKYFVDIFILVGLCILLSVLSFGYFGLTLFFKKRLFWDYFWNLLVIQGYFKSFRCVQIGLYSTCLTYCSVTVSGTTACKYDILDLEEKGAEDIGV